MYDNLIKYIYRALHRSRQSRGTVVKPGRIKRLIYQEEGLFIATIHPANIDIVVFEEMCEEATE